MKTLPTWWCPVFVSVAAVYGGVAVVAESRDIVVQTSLDRTAVWVADRIRYTITVGCKKGVDILADDLSKEKLHVEGLEILGSSSDRATDRDGGTVYTFSFDLATYRVDVPELKIAPLTLRYYVKRAGQRIGDAAPAGEVQVPAAAIAFRSTLPDGQETYAIRDGRGIRPRDPAYAWLQAVGLGFVLVTVVPVSVAVMAVVRRKRSREQPPSPRRVRHDERASLEALQALDISTPAIRRNAYSRLNTLVRDHVHHVAGFDAASLTPAEIDAALARIDQAGVPAQSINAVLTACDQARYALPDALPSLDACRSTIEQAAQVITSQR
jgi:hypothetical protein